MHKKELAASTFGRSQAWINKQHRDHFATWLREKLLEVRTGELDLDVLALGPNSSVAMYQGYDINAYTFYSGKQDKKSKTQNSGVRIDACYENNQQLDTYYGIIEELHYEELNVPLFWC